jgi:hypothetical protein
MSTQRRENGSTPATKTCRLGPRYRLRTKGCMECAGSYGLSSPVNFGRFDHAHTSAGTAPVGFFPSSFHPIDKDLSLRTPEQLATNSLQSDYRSTQLVRLVPVNNRRGSPPPGGRPPCGSRHVKVFRVILSAHPLFFRFCTSPSTLAMGTGSLELPDRRVRWQKKFAFPARRKRLGLQY